MKRLPKKLTDTLYCYVEAHNGKHARTVGANLFGSYSAYVNALIARDRDEQPILGTWKAKGESKLIREGKHEPDDSGGEV